MKTNKNLLKITAILLLTTLLTVGLAGCGFGIDATMSHIKGDWTQSMFSNTFTFIPSQNIKGLVLQFDIYNSNNKLINTITKTIGDVKQGQQYSVTLTADEYWSGSSVKTSVKSGTISLF